MSIPFVYNELLEACRLPGCPVCRLSQRAVQRYLVNLFYENVNDGDLRAQLRKSLGFCNTHAWELLEPGIGDALGVAIIYHDVLVNVLRRLPEAQVGEYSENWLTSLVRKMPRALEDLLKSIILALTPRARCPACQQQDQSVALYLSELVNDMERDELLQALSGSDGLCLPHLRQAFQKAAKEAVIENLLSISQARFASIDAELAEIIRKSDYRFHHEQIGSERDAWRRVVGLVAGEPPRLYGLVTNGEKRDSSEQ
jgi:hypothetical protein